MTITSLLDGGDFVWHYAIDVRGIGVLFSSTSLASQLSGFSAYSVCECIEGVPEHGGDRIDYDARRVIGGSLQVRCLDDAAGTIESLIRPRVRRVAYLTADCSKVATSISVNESAALGTVAYLDGETITVSAKPTATSATIARGAFGSKATKHLGTSTQGADLYSYPPSWSGRKVRLWVFAVRGQTVIASEQVGAYTLDATPTYDGVRWTFSYSPLIDAIARRKFGSSVTDEHKASLGHQGEPTSLYTQSIKQWSFLTSSTTAIKQYALLKGKSSDDVDTCACYPVDYDSSDFVNKTVALGSAGSLVGNRAIASRPLAKNYVQAKHVAIIDGLLPYCVLKVLQSHVGDAALGTYDLLPGVEADIESQVDGSFGAGIDDVDTSSFISRLPAIGGLSVIVDSVRSVDEFLSDLCLLTGLFWYTTRSGQLSVKRLGEDLSTSVLTLDESCVIALTGISHDVSGAMPRIKLKTNYNPVVGEHEATLELVDYKLTKRWPDKQDAVELSSYLLCVDGVSHSSIGYLSRPSASREEAQSTLRRLQVQSGRGRVVVSLRVNHLAYQLSVGDKIALDLAAYLDLEGGTLANRDARVLSWRPNFSSGTVEVTVELLDKTYVFAPSFDVLSWDAGTKTATLASSVVDVYGGIGTTFRAGWTINLYDLSSPATAPEPLTIASVTATTITFTTAPTFTPTTGDFGELLPEQNSGSGTNASGYDVEDFTYSVSDALAASQFAQIRWR